MSDLGVAYVQIQPSMRNFSPDISGKLGAALKKPLSDAGNDAGSGLSRGISEGISKSEGRLKSSMNKIGGIFKAGLGAAGVAGGLLLAKGISESLDTEAATDKLVAQLGGSEWAEGMGQIAGDLYADAFGNSVAETGEALRKVLNVGLLPEDATNAQIEALTAKVLTFADVMDQDLGMATEAVAAIMRNDLAGSADEALDLLTRGVQQGADKSEDLLETFQEYSSMFRDLGISAEDATGLMIQGLAGGARDADKVADALKELAIRAQDGSKSSAEGFAAIGLSAEQMTAKFAAGGAGAREGLKEVLDGLNSLEDPVARNAAAVALFGTQAEDMGDALFALDLDTAAARLGTVEGATDKLGSAYDNASTRLRSFQRKALQKLVSFIGGKVIPAIERFAGFIGPKLSAAVDTIAPIIAQVVDGFTTLTAAFTEGDDFGADGIAGFMAQIGLALRELTPLIDGFQTAWSATSKFISENGELVRGALAGIAVAITALLVPALVALVAPMLAAVAPFVLAGVAIAAIGAGIAWLMENVDGFNSFVSESLPQVGQIFSDTFNLIMGVVELTVGVMSWLWNKFGDDLVAVAETALGLVAGVIQGTLDIIQGIIQTVTGLISGDWDLFWNGLGLILDGALGILKTILDTGLALLKGAVKTALNVILAIFGMNLDSIKTKVRLALNVVKTIFRTTLDTTKNFVKGRLNSIVNFFKRLPGRVKGAFRTLGNAISSPFKAAFRGVKNLWNKLVGGFSFSIPDWVPGLGGKGFSIPKMHTGGIFEAGGGRTEGLALLKSGEGVFTPDQMAALGAGQAAAPASPGRVVLEVAPGSDELFERWLKNLIRVRGGDVQTVLGG